MLASVLIPSAFAQVNFDRCLQNLNNGDERKGGTDNRGRSVSIKNATAISLELCYEVCGSSQEPFNWSVFSKQFAAWLLPWLALISQLPFGAKERMDNIMAMILTVGSPVLAAYSLALTVLNGHWVARRFSGYNYPNIRYAVKILAGLQQAPLVISNEYGLLASLVVLPENDEWFREMTEWLEYEFTWSVSAAASIGWVVIAYIFTVIDSFAEVTEAINSNGQGVGSLWLWLLPIVVGWLQISPKCDDQRLTAAVERANKIAYLASDVDGQAILASDISFKRAISLQKPNHSTLQSSVLADQQVTSPIFNYARFLSWVQAVEEVASAFHYASEHAEHNETVDPASQWKKGDRNEILALNRRGTNDQVTRYCKPPPYVRRSRWGPHVFQRFATASALALVLQWSTTGAAIIVVWFTPTTGLGCRSGAYLLYACISTIIWALMVVSSGLAHYSTCHETSYHRHCTVTDRSRRITAFFSILLRRVGKVLAVINALWIVASCIFQFTNVFDRCYCNASVLGRGDAAYNVIKLLPEDETGIIRSWAAGVALALTSAFIFVAWVQVYIAPTLPEN